MVYFALLTLFTLLCFCDTCQKCGETLFLTPLIESGQIEKAKKLSKVSEKRFGCNTESYSGYFTVNKAYNSNLFFWFFKAKDSKAPIILWLQGGPGASSMYGLFMENGPFEITEKMKIKCRK
ncbi:venom serine carboxypeptidase-like isoform X2, partial [Leptotrombidium deliense]